MLDGKNVLITGGTGSFGKKSTEIILKRYIEAVKTMNLPREIHAMTSGADLTGASIVNPNESPITPTDVPKNRTSPLIFPDFRAARVNGRPRNYFVPLCLCPF